MKTLSLLSLLAVLLLALGLGVLPSSGQTNAIIITNADATNYVGLVSSPELPPEVVPRMVVQYANAMKYYSIPPVNTELSTLAQQAGPKFTVQYANGMKKYSIPLLDAQLSGLLQLVGPRIVVEYANGMKYYTIPTLDMQLSDLVQQVGPKFTVQYANGMKYYSIPPINSELLGFIGQVAPKFTIQYANAAKFYSLGYPKELINDTVAPKISGLTVKKVGANAVISWSTDELATTVLRFGTEPGNLNQLATDDTFRTLHQATISGYVNGTTYYYTIEHVDRSGNVFQSQEYNFNITIFPVFLPMVRR